MAIELHEQDHVDVLGPGEARGTGREQWDIYSPGHGPERVYIVAFDLGRCDGKLAYREVTFWFPGEGETATTNPSLLICKYGAHPYN